MKIVRTARGARLVDQDVTLSEIRSTPGPTHTLFDVLAACVSGLAPGPRVCVLGFAGGGMIAPLRAMGFDHAIDAVDLSRAGESVFRELSSDWAGTVTLQQDDAARWLRGKPEAYDLIVEDLSVRGPDGTIKPYCSFDELPALVQGALRPGGIAVTNLLPLPGTSWDSLLMRIALAHRNAVAVSLDEYENRFVLAGEALPPAAETSRRVRAALRAIDSDQCRRLSFRTLLRSDG